MNYHTDLIFGEVFCIFIFFHSSDSGISVLTGLHCYFRRHDSENTEYVHVKGKKK